MKHSPTDDRTVMPDRYEVQSTEELQAISQAFGIGKKEQFSFGTNPIIWLYKNETNNSRNSSDLIME